MKYAVLIAMIVAPCAATHDSFDTVRVDTGRDEAWVRLFHELKSLSNSKDETAVKVLRELRNSFMDKDYIITDFASLILLSQEGKALISSDTKKIMPHVAFAINAACVRERDN